MSLTAQQRTADSDPKSKDANLALISSVAGRKVWIDLDNSPHVPFFVPIIRELERLGCSITITARDAFQVKELVELYGLNCKIIGHHYGKNTVMKLAGIVIRTLQLLPAVLSKRPDLAVAHGSRAQITLGTLLRIPTLHIGDYEHATGWVLIHPSWVLTPEVIPTDSVPERKDRVLHYPGIKEDVYVPDFKPDPEVPKQLGLSESDIVVTIRPPASEAHYHNPLSDKLFYATVEFLSPNPSVKMVVLPRNQRQADLIRETWPKLFEARRMIIPEHALDGLNLIWFSDLVISGGGTMNREAAALGVPVYSIFRGKIGAVDHYLCDAGRLVLIESPEELATKVRVERRARPETIDNSERPALRAIVNSVVQLLTKSK